MALDHDILNSVEYRFDCRPGTLSDISVIVIIEYCCRCRAADLALVHQEHDVCPIVPYLHRIGNDHSTDLQAPKPAYADDA